MATEPTNPHVRRLRFVLETANADRAAAGDTRLGYGFLLHAGTYHDSTRERPCWSLTTPSGESMPLMPEVLRGLETNPCWLAGAYLVSFGSPVTQSPDRPVEALIMMHVVAPNRRTLRLGHSDFLSVLHPHASVDGIAILTIERPPGLPR